MSRLCRLKTKTHGEDGQWAYEEITKLREQVEAQAAVIEKLRDAFVHIQEYWNGDANEGAMFDALTHIENVAHEALAIPTNSTQILDEVRREEREKVIEKCVELGAIERDGVFAEEIRAME